MIACQQGLHLHNDYDDLIEDENHHEEKIMMTCRGGSGDNICMMMI